MEIECNLQPITTKLQLEQQFFAGMEHIVSAEVEEGRALITVV